MKKKQYIEPHIEVYQATPCHLLSGSPDSVIDFPWSGSSAGTAGPDEIDENSTFDAF
ncbi:MAG: hypothetical protein IJ069_01020 [Prevotella sp.]|nr:hypothetical protein [Prevotella sp.]